MNKYNLRRRLFQAAEKFWALNERPSARLLARELGMDLDCETTDLEVFSWLCRNEPNKQDSEDVDL